MADVGIVIDRELERLAERLDRLAGVALDDLMDTIGSEVESQTRRRIESERSDADGTEWDAWSETYKATRHGGHQLLQGEGDLLDSITYQVTGEAVIVGTNLIYGAIHQLGGEPVGIPIPARPYLGISKENEDDILDIVELWIDDQVMGAV